MGKTQLTQQIQEGNHGRSFSMEGRRMIKLLRKNSREYFTI